MNHYIELTLIPNEEIPMYFLWEKLYRQIHLAFVEVKEPNNTVKIGVSFPQYDAHLNSLGCKLRLFASSSDSLEKLNLTKWLSRLNDYVHITSIKPVPDTVNTFACFFRIRERKTNSEKAEHTAKRLNISFDQALEKLQGRSEKQSDAPFIRMLSFDKHKSESKDKNIFKLVIGMEEKALSSTNENMQFNTYGLSKTATIPWF